MIVGLTGGIGSGKSTVAKLFSAFDTVAIYIADTEAKNLMNTSKALRLKISKEFGEKAYQNKRSDDQVKGTGTVSKLLNDDNKGIRHQKLILRLGSGQTILIAHNIDLAPRINSISQGDQVEFYGEYEWNDRGGVVHWTHRDPNGYHFGGWLKHQGRTYQ